VRDAFARERLSEGASQSQRTKKAKTSNRIHESAGVKKYLGVSSSGRGFRVLQGLVQSLIALNRAAFDNPPAIVVLAEPHG
jgi:hypothetical protein